MNIKAKIILVDRTSLEGLGLRYDLGSKQQFFNDIAPRIDSTGTVSSDGRYVADAARRNACVLASAGSPTMTSCETPA